MIWLAWQLHSWVSHPADIDYPIRGMNIEFYSSVILTFLIASVKSYYGDDLSRGARMQLTIVVVTLLGVTVLLHVIAYYHERLAERRERQQAEHNERRPLLSV